MYFVKPVFLFLIIAIFSLPVFSQTDTLKIQHQTDTSKLKTPKVIQSLQQYSKREGFLARSLRSMLVSKAEITEFDNAAITDNHFSQHDFKVVRKVSIINLEPFGYSVQDTQLVPNSLLEKAGNAVHFKTHRGRIRNGLLFKEGEVLEPFALSESERLVRQTPYILDARIIVYNTPSDDSVDVKIITKDIWSFSAGATANPLLKTAAANFKEVNFLGFGHTLRADYFIYNRPGFSKGIDASYQIPNFSTSYINTELHYRNLPFNKSTGFSINRGFVTTTTKIAGGLAVDWVNQAVQLIPDTTFYSVKYALQDAWVARSFPLLANDLWQENRTRFVSGLRIRNLNYTKRENTEQSIFHNSKLYLLSSGFSLRKYYRDRFLFGFGRTEDIPVGRQILFTYGYENGEFEKRLYTGTKLAGAKFGRRFGYLYASAEFGSYYDGKNWEQGVLSIETLYFSKLIEVGNYKIRQFFRNQLAYGINRINGENLNIANENGLRGFTYLHPIGTKRYNLSIESNIFTPLSLLGFRMAAIAFADFSWLAAADQHLFAALPYQGYGIGLRFRNEYLNFNTFQVLLAYYPLVPNQNNNFRLLNATRPYYNFKDFDFSQPLVAPF